MQEIPSFKNLLVKTCNIYKTFSFETAKSEDILRVKTPTKFIQELCLHWF